MKITDLEKFALEHIFRPYQSMLGYDESLNDLPCDIDFIPQLAQENPEWWILVQDRIVRMKVWFPKYIKHEIVTLINF